MNTIEIYYNTGISSQTGKKYRVPHTIAFGYDISICFQLGAEQQTVQYDSVNQRYLMTYDPRKAGMKVRQNGYMELVIGI